MSDNASAAVGRKNDAGKRQWRLLPWAAVDQIVGVLTEGARKYAPDNWRKVPDWRGRYFDAALRHLAAWQRGEANDPEWGYSHLAHAGCCVLFLLALELDPPEPPPPPAAAPVPPEPAPGWDADGRGAQ